MVAAALSPDPHVRWEGRSAAELAIELALPTVEIWSRIGSTNDRARALLAAGEPAFTAVLAETQTAGRGRSNRRWYSPAGTGLWVSFVLRPLSLEHRPLLPLLIGIGLARAIERTVGATGTDHPAVGLKWPNDVWMGAGKVAGILCEATGRGVVAGIGVNVAAAPPEVATDAQRPGAAVADCEAAPVSRFALLEGLVGELRSLTADEPTRLRGVLADEWRRRDVLRGRTVRVDGASGRVEGIDEQGHLLLATSSGLRRIAAGHVDTINGQGTVDAAGR